MLDRHFWADTAALFKRRDNWDDSPTVVVADKTTGSDGILRFDGDLAGVPDQGNVLERSGQGDTVYTRGMFPILDAANKKVGAMFVVRDITVTYNRLIRMRNTIIFVIICAMVMSWLVLSCMLTRTVFRRLESIIGVATSVVGGEYDARINVHSKDEIGQFEQLFE
jgi:HAMP domain-containing protein